MLRGKNQLIAISAEPKWGKPWHQVLSRQVFHFIRTEIQCWSFLECCNMPPAAGSSQAYGNASFGAFAYVLALVLHSWQWKYPTLMCGAQDRLQGSYSRTHEQKCVAA